MKTLTITKEVYTLDEAKDNGLYEKAYCKWLEYYTGWTDEILESLKALCNQAGITIKDYSIGDRESYIKYGDIPEIQGSRALTWIENNIIEPNRLKWTDPKRFKPGIRYGYRAGVMKDCPFTGVCYDHDFLDALAESVKSGDDLETAFNSLANTAEKLIENETSTESFDCANEGMYIDEYGNIVDPE